ncbi:hypothetical protein H106_08128 [Trichophyton rubrum CBS 735.88]|nr:hypothetical protein H106_08128 [Trichophyton rubrum CBS 735.88]
MMLSSESLPGHFLEEIRLPHLFFVSSVTREIFLQVAAIGLPWFPSHSCRFPQALVGRASNAVCNPLLKTHGAARRGPNGTWSCIAALESPFPGKLSFLILNNDR